jgi:lambda family phage tail tape measure protein
VRGPEKDAEKEVTDIASLGLRIESSQVTQADAALDKFTDSAAKAEQAADKLGKKTGESGEKFDSLQDFISQFRRETGALKNSLDALQNSEEKTGSQTTALTQKVRNSIQTLLGFDSRTRAVTSLFGSLPLRITAAAVAVGILTKAYVEGAREAETFAQAVAKTGDSAGATVGQLALMSKRLDAIGGTRAAASKALATFVEAGVSGADSLERFTATAQQAERSIGIPLEQIAKNFAALQKAPTAAATEIQKSFAFLTPAVLKYISEQERAGNVTRAAAAASAVYDAALRRNSDAVDENVGYLIRGGRAVKKVWDEAWDAILGVGRQKTDEERLADLVASRGARPLGQLQVDRAGIARVRESDLEEAALRKQVAAAQATAKARAEVAEQTRALIAIEGDAAQRTKDYEEAQKAINAAWAQFNLADVERKLSAVTTRYEVEAEELEALQAANLISVDDYYARRQSIVEKSAAAEIASLRQVNAVLAQQDEMSSVERIAAQNKIAENTQRIADIQKRTTGELKVLAIEHADANKKIARSYDEARMAADRYVETLMRRYRLEVEGMGLGDRERQRMRERSDIEAEFEERRQQHIRDDRLGRLKEGELEKLLQIEDDALQRSLDAYDEYYEELEKKQSDWRVGASEAFRNFADEAKNVAGQMQQVVGRALDGLTDGLVNFAMTGEESFGDLAKSILADLLKIELKIALSQVLGPLFGSMGIGNGSGITETGSGFGSGWTVNGIGGPMVFGGGRAKGGPVQKGVAYLVNENTPRSEMFVAPADGYVGPVGGGTNITNYNSFGPNSNAAQLSAELDQRDAMIRQQVQDDRRRGRQSWSR